MAKGKQSEQAKQAQERLAARVQIHEDGWRCGVVSTYIECLEVPTGVGARFSSRFPKEYAAWIERGEDDHRGAYKGRMDGKPDGVPLPKDEKA